MLKEFMVLWIWWTCQSIVQSFYLEYLENFIQDISLQMLGLFRIKNSLLVENRLALTWIYLHLVLFNLALPNNTEK